MSSSAEGLPSSRLAALAAPALLLVTPLIVFLRYHAYDLARPEALLALLTVILAGIGFGWASLRRPKLGAGMLALLIALFIDAQFEFEVPIPGIGKAKILAVGALGLYFLLARHSTASARWTSLLAGTMLASTFLLPAGQLLWVEGAGRAGDRRLPLVVHLILDEHIGVEGLRPENATAADDLRAFLQGRAFRVLGGAYSQYPYTAQSLGQVLNLIPGQQVSGEVRQAAREEFELTHSSYFDRLARAGYDLSIYQTEWLDLCQAATGPHRCETVGLTRLGLIQDRPLTVSQKLSVLARTYFGRMSTGRAFMRASDSVIRMMPAWARREQIQGATSAYSTFAGAVLFERLGKDLASAQRGQFFLAHVMMPHYPYIFDDQCRQRPPEMWLSREDPAAGDVHNTPAGRTLRYDRYVEQLRCTMRRVDEIIEAIPAELRTDAVVLVHGDHGSRIARIRPQESRRSELVSSDYVDSYSTLFAVRGPGIEPEYETGQVSIACAMRALADTDYKSLSGVSACTSPPTVFLPDRTDGFRFTERPLPAFQRDRGIEVARR